MAPKKKGGAKRKKPKAKLKATPINMKSPRSSPTEKKREEEGIRLEEEEVRDTHLEEDEGRDTHLEEDQGRDTHLQEDQGRDTHLQEEKRMDLEEQRGFDLEKQSGIDGEEEKKTGTPTDQQSKQARTEILEQLLHTPTPQKWGHGKSYLDMARLGKEEAEARTEDLKKASLSLRMEMVRPSMTKLGKDPSSAVHNVVSHGPRPPREKSSEERKLQEMEIKKRLDDNSAKRKAEREMKARMALEPLLSLAKDFLTSFRKPGEESLNCSMCAARVASMVKKGGKLLKIDFNHLLNKKYKNLALRIGMKTDRDYLWLKPVLIKFLVEEGLSESESENVELSFKNCLARIQTVKEFMQNREEIARDVPLLNGAGTVYAAAVLGRVGFQAHVKEIFRKHDEGITFNGGFTLDDLIIVDEERVVVLADPFVPEKIQGNLLGIPLPVHKCNDVKKIWTLLSPFYTRKDGNDADELPLHFEDLRDKMMEVKQEEVSTEKFRELITCCFGLASCSGRSLFTKEAYTITRRFGIEADPALRVVFKTLPPKLINWKETSANSPVDAIRKVALYGDGVSRFQENRFGCLECDRQVLQHGGDHHGLNDMDELELLTSKEYKGVLHKILKAMIYDGDPHGKYASLLSAYKAVAKHDRQDLPTGS